MTPSARSKTPGRIARQGNRNRSQQADLASVRMAGEEKMKDATDFRLAFELVGLNDGENIAGL